MRRCRWVRIASLTMAALIVATPSSLTATTISKREKPEIALHRAVAKGDIRTVKELIGESDALNRYDQNGFSPLNWAIYNGDIEMVRLLIAHGADPTAWSIVIERLRERLEPKGLDVRKQPTLHQAISEPEILNFVLEQGVDPDIDTMDGHTALNLAAAHNEVRSVKILLRHGADVNQATDYGATALHNAAYSGNLRIVRILVKTGADLKARSTLGNENRTPYEAAMDAFNYRLRHFQIGAAAWQVLTLAYLVYASHPVPTLLISGLAVAGIATTVTLVCWRRVKAHAPKHNKGPESG